MPSVGNSAPERAHHRGLHDGDGKPASKRGPPAGFDALFVLIQHTHILSLVVAAAVSVSLWTSPAQYWGSLNLHPIRTVSPTPPSRSGVLKAW